MAKIQRSIQVFARVSKASNDAVGSRKRKQTVDDEQSLSTTVKKQRVCLETFPETPTKAIKQVLSNLKLSVPRPSVSRSTKRKRAATADVETLPTPEDSDIAESLDKSLPEELEELIALNISFLKALALHYAHSGVACPVDVRLLSPIITRTWGKRKVLFDDIRICLGVMQRSGVRTSSTFDVSNYGNGKFCIELESHRRKRGILAQAFDEIELRSVFEEELKTLWRTWPRESGLEQFSKSLPRAQIIECASYTKMKPALAKGQQRLEEVLRPRAENSQTPSERPQYRQFPAHKKAPITLHTAGISQAAPKDKENSTPPPPTANFRALSLLDRIQKKQEMQAEIMTNQPTKATLERRAALERSEEMIQILELLATTKGPGLRASFPLPALVRSIQSSLRSPMSPEEIERCIVVIGKDLAAGYVEKKEFGSMKGVVVNRMFKPDAEKVRQVVAAVSA